MTQFDTPTAPFDTWLEAEFTSQKIPENEKKILVRFWRDAHCDFMDEWSKNQLKSDSKPSNVSVYKNNVFYILQHYWEKPDGSMVDLQHRIENLTMRFDEKDIYHSCSTILKMLILKDEETAKEYLRGKALSEDDQEMLSRFSQYTIEALIIYVLCSLFSSESDGYVRVATLIDCLERSVRSQASLLLREKKKDLKDYGIEEKEPEKEKNQKKLMNRYPIGSGLVELMERRGLIELSSDIHGPVRDIKKKKGKYILKSTLYASCKFDLKLLPVKYNLPMVCEPLPWESLNPTRDPETISDLTGGYLSGKYGTIHDRYKMLSSGNVNNFYIKLKDNYQDLLHIMNKLQGQAFRINSRWLKSIKKNRQMFVNCGLLKPEYLADIRLIDVIPKLRERYMKDNEVKENFSFSFICNGIQKDISKARRDKMILEIAEAYDGYQFYLPAFLDFRGRIYRCGILHFHECDLARSLILFANVKIPGVPRSMDELDGYVDAAIEASAFHFTSYRNMNDARDFMSKVNEHLDEQEANDKELDTDMYLIDKCADAKNPFQLMANLNVLRTRGISVDDLCSIPITQDASASAYQIMSYLLLDDKMARLTNLIPNEEGEILDIYQNIRDELIVYMEDKLESNLFKEVKNQFTRKIVKGIFMPIIYGKTIISTATDLRAQLSAHFVNREFFPIAKLCFSFFKERYKHMYSLIKLIRNIGWVKSSLGYPVYYSVDYFNTVQDYKVMDAISISLYDRVTKKRHKVTLRIPSEKRDGRKTEAVTFVNVIHQFDACLAMRVVYQMMYGPVYTVHDNFITNILSAESTPDDYSKSICRFGPPLGIINRFICQNLLFKEPVAVESAMRSYGIYPNKQIRHTIMEVICNDIIPPGLNKRQQSLWVERMKGIQEAYRDYVMQVCGAYSEDPFYLEDEQECPRHALIYSEFTNLILNSEFPNYSIHY